jgi:hypothetical protein
MTRLSIQDAATTDEESIATQRLLRAQRKSLRAGYLVFAVIALSAGMQLLIECLYGR